MFQGAFSKLTLFLVVLVFVGSPFDDAFAAYNCERKRYQCYESLAPRGGYGDIETQNRCIAEYKELCPGENTPPADDVKSTKDDDSRGLDTSTEAAGDSQSDVAAGDAAERAEDAARKTAENCAEIEAMAAKMNHNNTELNKLNQEICTYADNAKAAKTDKDADWNLSQSQRKLEEAKRIQTQEREFANLRRKLEEEAEICRKAYKVAEECCSNPESCLQKPDGVPSEKDGAVGDAIKTALGVAGSVPASSVSAMCGKMKTMGNIMTAFNGYLAVQCSRTVGQCKNKCKVSPELTAQIREKCESNYDSEMCINVRTLKEELDQHTEQCAIADNGSMELAKQAIVSQAASKYADTCKKMAEEIAAPTGEDLKPTDLFANTSCANPTAQTMAFCQAQCSRPGAQQDPNCAAFLGRLNNSGLGQFNNGGVDPNSLLSDLNVGDEGTQNPNFQDIAPVNAGSTGVGAGGGGGLLGSGAPQGGDSDDGGGGTGEAGHNTKIDRGLASGNGYSGGGSRMMSGSGGGFSGYGNSKAITNSGKAFNLKDFLPNNKAPLKPFRGLASVSQEISPAHDDIFKKVTARFYQLCLRDALYDCSTLQKLKSGRD